MIIKSTKVHSLSIMCTVLHILYSHAITAVFERPSVFSDSNTDVMASFNETVTFKCRIHAPTVNGVTIVVWLKSNLPIDDMEHYKITRITLPGVDDLIISQLTIKAVTYEDIDIYACYCYYNSTMVTSSESVVSNYVYFVLSTEGKCINTSNLLQCAILQDQVENCGHQLSALLWVHPSY